MTRPRTVWSVFLVALVAAAGYTTWRSVGQGAELPQYKRSRVESGPLTAAVSSTGTLNPVVSVIVGSQVSGQIKTLAADFNSVVKAGQVIARIDPETFELRVRQAEADLEATRAALAVQRAERVRALAALTDAQRDLERKQQLIERNFLSPAERDKAVMALAAAKAAVDVNAAQIGNGEALVRQRSVQVAQARVDLARTEIRSPVDGIVVKRSVNAGQTVAASLQAPELFIIARNLNDMQVEVAIDEADVGRIQVGQKATFTVDAFPGRSFTGEVTQVRNAATVVSNVVTYTVIVSAANRDGALLPGMTANVRIVTAEREKTLKVANTALRFRPAGATEDRPTRSVPTTSPAAPAKTGPAGNGFRQLRERLVTELKLDADQQTRVDAIFSGQRERLMNARELEEPEKTRALERLRSEIRGQINVLLTPEQQKRYGEIVAETQAAGSSEAGGAGRVWVLDGEGKPHAVAVRLGVSDGSMTEVLSGELKEGDEVLTGQPGPSRPATAPRLF